MQLTVTVAIFLSVCQSSWGTFRPIYMRVPEFSLALNNFIAFSLALQFFFIKNFMKERLEFRHLSVKYCKKHGKYSFYQVYYSVRRDLM